MYIFNTFYLLHSYTSSFLICLCFNMVSLRGQKKLGPSGDRSPLGLKFKISDEHPHPFHMGSLPRDYMLPSNAHINSKGFTSLPTDVFFLEVVFDEFDKHRG